MQLEFAEPEPYDLARGFSADSLAPKWDSDPVPEFRVTMFGVTVQADPTTEPLSIAQENAETGAFLFLPYSIAITQKLLRLFGCVWMWDT